jgi:hypothetical protein
MAVHEVDSAVAHEVPPLAVAGQQGRDVVVAALVRQRNTE